MHVILFMLKTKDSQSDGRSGRLILKDSDCPANLRFQPVHIYNSLTGYFVSLPVNNCGQSNAKLY